MLAAPVRPSVTHLMSGWTHLASGVYLSPMRCWKLLMFNGRSCLIDHWQTSSRSFWTAFLFVFLNELMSTANIMHGILNPLVVFYIPPLKITMAIRWIMEAARCAAVHGLPDTSGLLPLNAYPLDSPLFSCPPWRPHQKPLLSCQSNYGSRN